ncbi:MAG TPA: hypothetical protein VGO57_02680 [Verrucomicrobiae bacterium]|jgi:hypothetical protein
MSIFSRLSQSHGNRISGPMLFALLTGISFPVKADSTSADAEPNSPQQLSPGLVEPGLSQRAVPSPGPAPTNTVLNVTSFYRLNHPFENSLSLRSAPPPYAPPDPSEFRPVTTYAMPLMLRPQVFRTGWFNFYPWLGIAQSFDSNVELTRHGQISDFFFTPRFGFELQVGTPDSIYNENYDTIFAAHLTYEGYGDIFYEHPEFNAYNQRLDFTSRIGRDQFIVRPYASVSDITGSNLQIFELQNRTERIIANGGTIVEWNLTPVTQWRQTYNAFDFQHPDPAYIDYDTWSTRQELTWLVPGNNGRGILWGGAKSTTPNQGFGGQEYQAGFGWQGQFTPRWQSELWLGWGTMAYGGHVPERDNLSGVRYTGHTIFDYSPRVRFTLTYDRAYVYNETTKNDNYISTVTQLRAEINLGRHWFMVPYFGCSYDEYETSHQLSLELRPELELAYVFTKEDFKIISIEDKLAASRAFVKFGYDYIQNLRFGHDVTQDLRFSTGLNWNF